MLATHGLSVSFGGLRAVDGVDLVVDAGQLVGLIGPNGAGKTTCIDAVTGFVDSTGKVLLDGQEIQGLRPDRRARAGVARTWQGQELFDDLTVYENVRVAGERLNAWEALGNVLRPRRSRYLPEVDEALERFG
ncbi:MAG: ATP-binding cassette domain-containing protein, partial [Thermoleophilaceae bacterium]